MGGRSILATPILALAVFGPLGGVAGAVASQTAPRDDSPLKPICDRLCGGVWRQAPAYPNASDQVYVAVRYAWDPALGAIRATLSLTGGVAGIHQETVVLYGYDPGTKSVWTLRADGRSAPVFGTVTAGDDGITETTRPLLDKDGQMVTSMTFENGDHMRSTSEIHNGDQVVMGQPLRYERRPQ